MACRAEPFPLPLLYAASARRASSYGPSGTLGRTALLEADGRPLCASSYAPSSLGLLGAEALAGAENTDPSTTTEASKWSQKSAFNRYSPFGSEARLRAAPSEPRT